jgi:hypothetical protein
VPFSRSGCPPPPTRGLLVVIDSFGGEAPHPRFGRPERRIPAWFTTRRYGDAAGSHRVLWVGLMAVTCASGQRPRRCSSVKHPAGNCDCLFS